jgi:hypothetical protein
MSEERGIFRVTLLHIHRTPAHGQGLRERVYCADVARLFAESTRNVCGTCYGSQFDPSAESHRLRPSRNSDEEEHMKKIGFLTLLTMATVLFTLAFPAAAAGPKAPVAPAPAVAAAPAAPAVAPVPERHPHIDEALESMRAAKHHLESAEHNFDGHRAKAIEHLDRAIREAEICLSMK